MAEEKKKVAAKKRKYVQKVKPEETKKKVTTKPKKEKVEKVKIEEPKVEEVKVEEVKVTETPKVEEAEIKEVEVENNEVKIEEITGTNVSAVEPVYTPKKESKLKGFFSELFYFILVVGIICGLGYLVYYWYNNVYKKDVKNQNEAAEKLESYYSVSELEGKDFLYHIVINKKDYYIELLEEKDESDNEVKAIYNSNGEELYKGSFEYSYIANAENGDTYFITSDHGDSTNLVTLYKFDDKEFKEVNQFVKNGYDYSPIYYEKNGEKTLIGFYAECTGGGRLDSKYIYSISLDEEVEFSSSSSFDLNDDKELITTNSKYIVYKNDGGTYNVLNMTNGKDIIEDYEDVKLNNVDEDTFIVSKNSKYGIIDAKTKKIIDYEYDYIYPAYNGYLVEKESKVYLLTGKDNLIETDLTVEELKDKLFEAELKDNDGDRYLEVNTKYQTKYYTVSEEEITNIYDGPTVTKTDSMSYTVKGKEITFYNSKLEEMYKIDLSDYESRIRKIDLINNKVLVIRNNTVLYYDYNTGKEIDGIEPFSTTLKNIKVSYADNKVTIYDNDKEVLTEKYNIVEEGNLVINNLDNGFYLNLGNKIVIINKK
jgi:prolactin regulatory element-binding protein